jgi:hypothetical protein
MKKNIIKAFAIVIIAAMSACSVSVPFAVTDNSVGSKVGIARQKAFLNICVNCDVGISKAAANGGITKIATVDYKVRNSFFFVTYETIVTGE